MRDLGAAKCGVSARNGPRSAAQLNHHHREVGPLSSTTPFAGSAVASSQIDAFIGITQIDYIIGYIQSS